MSPCCDFWYDPLGSRYQMSVFEFSVSSSLKQPLNNANFHISVFPLDEVVVAEVSHVQKLLRTFAKCPPESWGIKLREPGSSSIYVIWKSFPTVTLLLALVQSILPAWVPVSPSPRSWWRLGWSGPRWGWPAPPAAWSQTGCWTPWGQSWRSGGEVMRERRDETKDEGQFGWWFKKCLNNRRRTVPRSPLSQSAALEKSVKHLMTFN